MNSNSVHIILLARSRETIDRPSLEHPDCRERRLSCRQDTHGQDTHETTIALLEDAILRFFDSCNGSTAAYGWQQQRFQYRW